VKRNEYYQGMWWRGERGFWYETDDTDYLDAKGLAVFTMVVSITFTVLLCLGFILK
jgi:hypothetical protein